MMKDETELYICKMSSSTSNDSPDCTNQCRSTQHGDIITAAISKRSISDIDLCSFLSYTCTRCESVIDFAGRTALHVAASCGRVDLIKWLIRNRHADIDAKDKESGYTALHRSIFYGKIHVALELIKLGATITELDLDNLTVLEHAMKDGIKPECSRVGELYSWGSNANNLLGPQQARETPELLDVFHKEYPNECVQQICIDQFHSVIITSSGKAYSCGHGQGGRLGLGIEKTVVTPHIINFSDSQKGEPITCVQASISRDHSIFLCSDGNALPRQLKHLSNELQGVCAGRYHSVAWGPKALYTWGLNAGQLGHKTNNKGEEQYLLTPKIVKVINIDNIGIKAVAASDGATVVCTERGDIYVLHEYLCRKIASSIIGGKLDAPSLNRQVADKLIWELKVAVLTNTGNLLLWQESDPQLCRCIFSINRAIVIKQVAINSNEILLVTNYGEAFKGYICQRKKKQSNVIDKTLKGAEKSAFHKFLEKEDCVLVQLKKISKIHRALFIQSDSKGKDFCVIQVCFRHIHTNFFEFPNIVESEMKTHFQILLEEVSESDDIHDVVFKVDQKYFSAHSFIISTKSPYLERLIRDSRKEVIILNDVNPDIFEQLLLFIYTGACDLTNCGEIKNEKLRKLCQKHSDPKDIRESLDTPEVPVGMSAYEFYNKVKLNQSQDLKQKNQNTKNPVRMLHELAKRFECSDLQKVLSNLDMQKFIIRFKHMQEVSERVRLLRFDRSMFPNLYDVTVKCKDHRELKAHKCVLAARLEYFNNMFSMRWRGNETSEVSLPFPKSIAEALLEFLYTDSLSYLDNIDTDHLFKVLVLADQLFVTRLKEQCEYLLTDLLTLRNAVQLLSFAHLYNAEKLKRCCMKFIVMNITPFLELRSLDDLEEEILRELTEFYFQEKQEVWCRVITPYSTAPSDGEIISVSSLYPVSLKDEVERVTTKTSQKRKSRPHREYLDSVIQFPDIPEGIPDSEKDFIVIVPSRLRSIALASERIKYEDIQPQFTKLTADKTVNSSDFHMSFNESTDFPELNSPPHVSGSFHQKTTPQKADSKHKMVKLSQKQRKRLSSEGSNVQTAPVQESPKNPWKIIPDISSPIEDRAIDELHKFYNSDNVTDEIITIERVAIGAIASPVWVPRTK
ncbi:hypothetical protein NQ314_019235 [Rhamnusium bicolor]|uniref:BTB domain-containing protein n=1 Tax=Rhamnusium bicolor TaxID=1586634 RepID=A0AAV8WPA1_9CUCU|nr:hypothetical protein NQ314_019235 [Rhamnusium bicolor]